MRKKWFKCNVIVFDKPTACMKIIIISCCDYQTDGSVPHHHSPFISGTELINNWALYLRSVLPKKEKSRGGGAHFKLK